MIIHSSCTFGCVVDFRNIKKKFQWAFICQTFTTNGRENAENTLGVESFVLIASHRNRNQSLLAAQAKC